VGRLTPAGRGDAGRFRPARPPLLWRTVLRLLVWAEDRRFLLADFSEEYAEIGRKEGRRAACRWARAQALRSVPPLLGRRIAVRFGPALAPPPRPRPEDRMSLLTRIAQDVRQAARAVRRGPRYAATVIATFALASGANIAVFSVVDSILLEPLPYPDPATLVMVHRVTDYGEDSGVSLLDLEDWRSGVGSFSSWAGYSATSEIRRGPGGAAAWRGIVATPELFEVLRVPPLLGRTLQPADAVGDRVIVLSHDLWSRELGSDPDIVGKAIRFESGTFTVVGVMRPDFYFPTPAERFWMPLQPTPYLEQRGAWFLQTIARLAPGASIEGAGDEAQRVAVRVAEETASSGEGTVVRVESRHEAYVGDTRAMFAILFGAVALVLIVACGNLANVALTRATTRGRELAVRAALGAGRGRLARQLVAEHILLALAGAGAGVGLSLLVVRGLLAVAPSDLPRLDEVGVHTTALAYAILVAIVSGVLFGAAPALASRRSALHPALSDGGRGSGGKTHHRSLGALVVAQVSLAVVLVLGATLLVNSFLRLSAVRPGFDMERIVAVRIDLPTSRYETPEAMEAFYGDLRGRLAGRPGVEAVGFTTHLPFSGSNIQATYYVDSDGAERIEHPGLALEVVGPGYFESAGIEWIAGRDIRAEDDASAPPVAVINQRMAELNWPGQSPIGRRFTLDDQEDAPWHEVIGVVGVTLKAGLDDEARPIAYFPRRQFAPIYRILSGRSGYITVRASVDPGRLIPMVREEIAAVDPSLPVPRIETGRQLVSATMVEPRFRTILLGAFAVVALLVALVGVYGVLSFAVARRTREIGIRMALGATAPRILSQVLRRSAWMLAGGLAIGIAGGLASSRVLASMLFGIVPSDPPSYAIAAAVVVFSALLACWLPARRASRVEPVVALRQE